MPTTSIDMVFHHTFRTILGRFAMIGWVVAACLVGLAECSAQYQPFGSNPYQPNRGSVTDSSHLGTDLGTTSSYPNQPAVASSAMAANVPEAIHWASHGLAIPYRWAGTSGNQNAKQVVLYASRDQGMNWQQVSVAAPQVHSFQYQAPGDGEYWFAIRTYDNYGNYQPAGPYKPEMRVIVDTQNPPSPRVEGTIADGILTARVEASDINGVDPNKIQIYAQLSGQPNWTPLTIQPIAAGSPNSTAVQGTLRLPTGVSQAALNVSIADQAGNRSVATSNVSARAGYYQANTGPQLTNPARTRRIQPSTQNQQAARDPFFLADQQYQGRAPGFTTASASSSQPFTNNAAQQPAQLPPWGTTSVSQTPPVQPTVQPWPVDSQRTKRITTASTSNVSNTPWKPDSPFKSASFDPLQSGHTTNRAPAASAIQNRWGTSSNHIAGIRSTERSVNSKNFEFDYELQRTGQWGIANVELWGTTDNGNSWRRYAIDCDRQSPIHVSVPSEGVYGFKILIESVGGFEPEKPRPGDQPEVLVRVDVTKPLLTLTRAEQGQGYLADRMEINWSVGEEDLADQPIDLFYSNRREGPWIPIASGIENTGQYAWRLQRHLPGMMFIRVEARDRAGNVSSAISSQPVTINLPKSTGTLLGIRSTSQQVNSSFGY